MTMLPPIMAPMSDASDGLLTLNPTPGPSEPTGGIVTPAGPPSGGLLTLNPTPGPSESGGGIDGLPIRYRRRTIGMPSTSPSRTSKTLRKERTLSHWSRSVSSCSPTVMSCWTY